MYIYIYVHIYMYIYIWIYFDGRGQPTMRRDAMSFCRSPYLRPCTHWMLQNHIAWPGVSAATDTPSALLVAEIFSEGFGLQ